MPDSITEILITAFLAVVSSIYVYDRNVRDRRFQRGEEKMQALGEKIDAVESDLVKTGGQHEVLQANLNGLKELVDTRLNTLSATLNRVEDMVANQYREHR